MLLQNKIIYRYIYNIKLNNYSLNLKYLLFYIFFIKFFLTNKSIFNFIFKFSYLRKNLFVITKAPYRYKLSKHQFGLQRMQLIFIFEYKLKNLKPLNSIFLLKFRHYLSSIDFCFFHLKFCTLQHIFIMREWVK